MRAALAVALALGASPALVQPTWPADAALTAHAAPAVKPAHRGTVVLRWPAAQGATRYELKPKGRTRIRLDAQASQIGGPDRSPQLTECFNKVLMRTRYPEQSRPATLRVPLSVKPRS